MKINNRLTSLWSIILLSMLCSTVVLCTSCNGGEEPNPDDIISPDKEVPDPDGTITLSMRDKDNGGTYIDNIRINQENFENSYDGYFASVDAVKGLGNVAIIPLTGWASKVAVIPGNGYVAYDNQKKKFYRLYVKDYLVGTTLGIIGAEVKYQEPFKGKDEAISLDVQSLTIPANVAYQPIVFKNQGVVLFDVKSDKFRVEKTSTYDYPFLTNGIAILTEPNVSPNTIEGMVTLTTLYGKETVIKIVQAGAEPFVRFYESNLELSAAQQTKPVEMFGNVAFGDLSVNSSASWCKAELVDQTAYVQNQHSKVKYIGDKPVQKNNTASNSAASYLLQLTLDENDSSEQRNATIIVKSKDGKAEAELKVVQKGIILEVTIDRVGFDKNQGSRVITLNTSKKDWEAESSADWCTFGKNGNQITINVTASTEDRIAVISFKGFDTKITVHQSKYAVGDQYKEDGIAGIVGYIGDKKRLLYQFVGEGVVWSTEDVQTGANSEDDGRYNMSVIKNVPYWEDSYPAFHLCEQLNTNGVTGWYLPALNELVCLPLKYAYKKDYWSSTEIIDIDKEYNPNEYAVSGWCDSSGTWRESMDYKQVSLSVIAVHKF